MSEQTAPTTGTEETNGLGQGFEPIASQDALDKIVQARVARERAKFSDYDDLKAKADKLAQFEESQKSEAQRAQERLDAAEKRASELELKATRAEVAAAKGVPVALLSGSTQAELESAADALIQFKGSAPSGPIAPREGTPRNSNSEDPMREFARSLFNSEE